MKKQTHWVMDYETLSDCFLGVFKHYKTDEVKVFTSGHLKNDIADFIKFLEDNIRNNQWHISFNGLGFDSQITEFILKNKKLLLNLPGGEIGAIIYDEAQEAIRRSNAREFAKYSEKKLSIRQIDVFKLNHWDNPAKRSSLKWIECSMDWHNVQDMPIDHTESINSVEKLKAVASYCRNDVAATKKIMQISSKQISLRANLSNTYNVNLYSASEPRIAKELFLHFLAKATKRSKYDLKQGRTFRKFIHVKDLILPYISFDGLPEFQKLLRNFRNLTINPAETKGGFKYSVLYKALKIDFGLGGLHAAKKGIYESDEHNIIYSSDVVSYYPNLAIRNKWHPAHINSVIFLKEYEWFFDERKKIPKSDPRNYVYKIILNSTYGLSNDKNSFLYDPQFTMQITINGQLLLTMLNTMLAEKIPGAVPLMLNTDGLEMIIPKRYSEQYLDICKEWEELTDLKLEHDTYQKLIIPDVNNYIGIFQPTELSKTDFYDAQKKSPENKFEKKDGKFYMSKTKCKGRFEFKDRPLHKNKSFTIIPKALFNYYVHDILPEDTLKRNTNIFDYCGQTKSRGDWGFNFIYVDDKREIKTKPLQKTLRYLVTNKGGKLVKHNKLDNRNINVAAGKWLQTVFNQYEDRPFEEYDLNNLFYLNRIRKELESMEKDIFSNQLKINF